MTRKDIVLAGLFPSGAIPLEPVQVQKLFFLIDENIAERLGGKFFSFVPYDYGPFDKEVYATLEALSEEGAVAISRSGNLRRYALTEDGMTVAREKFEDLLEPYQDYVRAVSSFVRELTFTQLVSAIYRKYPHMRENSVFRS